ncbi:MAG: HEPN domain protein [bacterium ADurb.Bin429]|nr:MAG: HEPN domain protein [bacterium ADurb.Bin429]
MTDEIRTVVQYRLERAHEALQEADLLYQSGFYNTVASRLYYACFYSVSALLMLNNFHATTHAGTRSQFAQHFVHTGIVPIELNTLYSQLFRFRERSDYELQFRLDAEEANRLLNEAPAFIAAIERLIEEQQAAQS